MKWSLSLEIYEYNNLFTGDLLICWRHPTWIVISLFFNTSWVLAIYHVPCWNFLCVYPVWGSLTYLDLRIYSFYHIWGKHFSHSFFKHFFSPFFSISENTCIRMINIVPQSFWFYFNFVSFYFKLSQYFSLDGFYCYVLRTLIFSSIVSNLFWIQFSEFSLYFRYCKF